MTKNSEYVNVKIKKRSWKEWLFSVAFILWLLFWTEIATGSFRESEPRAAWISVGVVIISLVVYLFFPKKIFKKK